MVSARKIAIEAALAGARVARAKQLAGLHPEQKSGDRDDLVTEGDEAAQKAILEILPRTLGGQPVGVLAEEKTDAPEAVDVVSRRWVIDPIDGTLPYSKGEPYWCVSVALQEKLDVWESRLGVIYQACAEDTQETLRGRLFWAARGMGAYMHDPAAGTRQPLARPGRIAQVAEFSAEDVFAAWAKEEFKRRGIATQFRRSICFAGCEMLLGQKCAVVQDAGPLEWDVAAITLIAREASAHVYCKRVDATAVCDRYEVVMAWDGELFGEFCRKLS